MPQKYILLSYMITSAIYHLQLLTYFLNMQHTVHKFTHVHTAILHICCMYNNAMYRYMQASLCPRALYMYPYPNVSIAFSSYMYISSICPQAGCRCHMYLSTAGQEERKIHVLPIALDFLQTIQMHEVANGPVQEQRAQYRQRFRKFAKYAKSQLLTLLGCIYCKT